MYRIASKTRPVLQVENVTEAFLNDIDVTEGSRQTYRRQIKQFTEYLEKKEILHPDRNTIIEFREYLLSSGLSQTTTKAYLLTVKHLYNWLEENDLSVNIAKGIRLPKPPTGFRKDHLEVDQAKILLATFDRTTQRGKRDYAIANLLVRCGLREIELCRADVEDIKVENGKRLLYLQGKGMRSKEEFVLLTDNAYAPIADYLQARSAKNKEPLFTSASRNNHNGRMTPRSISRIIKTAMRKVGLDSPRLTCHSLRHSSLTWCRQAGGSYDDLKLLARHSSIEISIKYCHGIDRMGKMAPEHRIDELLGKVA